MEWIKLVQSKIKCLIYGRLSDKELLGLSHITNTNKNVQQLAHHNQTKRTLNRTGEIN
jgi:hypothetical protein